MQYSKGTPQPLGAKVVNQGVNFAVFSAHATGCELCLFSPTGEEQRFPMSRTGDIWHVFIENCAVGTPYGFRVSGKQNEAKGALFNPQKLLLDPYAKKIEGLPRASNAEELAYFKWDNALDNAAVAPKSVVVGESDFDWENVQPPRHRWAETIIYEAHVKGFSMLNPAVPEALRGTYAGLGSAASIAYLKQLGITAIELQPVSYKADEVHLQKTGLTNYWGYSVLGHSAVDPQLAYDKADPIGEFKQMVKNLHQAGIEVILDVVYNHTVEGGKDSLTLCQRGIDNQSYYWLDVNGEYYNWTGCGNALNLSHPQVCQWAVDSLVYWVEEFHIDGFRFDLATTLGREPAFSAQAAFFEAVKNHQKLADIKWIAEPWDIGLGGYQVGHFPREFAEWNDKYRSTMRAMFCEEQGNLGEFARRLAGSDDLYWQHSPSKSINYFASHDGFCLQDLVSYNHKHNDANGEQNRDGDSHNLSNNHGVEGETDNEHVLVLREQTARALLATLFLSNGVPMLRMGDEFGHSQQGNNNAYCQDNEITWLNWSNINQARLAYTQQWIALRKSISLLSAQSHWWTENDVRWFNLHGQPMQMHDWHQHSPKALQILLQDKWLILLNAKKAHQHFHLPRGKWSPNVNSEIMHLDATSTALSVELEQMGLCVLVRQ